MEGRPSTYEWEEGQIQSTNNTLFAVYILQHILYIQAGNHHVISLTNGLQENLNTYALLNDNRNTAESISLPLSI